MDKIFFDLPYSFIYLDDQLVASRSVEDHRGHLRQVLQWLQNNGLVINREKCVLGQSKLEFLGHKISAASILPLAERVTAIQSFPRRRTVRELQPFLGLFNFYRRFIPVAAATVKPLTDAPGGGPSGNTPVDWSAARAAAFEAARSALATSALLDHPAASAEILLVTDASASHIGAVLQQRRRKQGWRPLAFFSQKLTPTQARYSAFDRELLAVHDSSVHFRHLLEGRSFVIFTDHLPLVGALHRVSEPKSDRQRRQLSFIAEFTAEIRHIAGQSNVVADTLSRPAVAGVSYADVAAGRAVSPSSGPQAGVAVTAAAAGLYLQPGDPLAAQTASVAVAGLQLPSSPVEQLASGQAALSAAKQGGGMDSGPLEAAPLKPPPQPEPGSSALAPPPLSMSAHRRRRPLSPRCIAGLLKSLRGRKSSSS
jgi:RNase H-like domain found in reverse transcriptase/Reverse transcriptase (RNA-dependent DNA polymerase)